MEQLTKNLPGKNRVFTHLGTTETGHRPMTFALWISALFLWKSRAVTLIDTLYECTMMEALR